MDVCSIAFSDHIDYGIMYSFPDHKEAIPQLKKSMDLDGYVLIKRCDLSIIRAQSNTRPVPIYFFHNTYSSAVDPVNTSAVQESYEDIF